MIGVRALRKADNGSYFTRCDSQRRAEGLGGATHVVTVEATYSRSVPDPDARGKATSVSDTRQFVLTLPTENTATLEAVVVGSSLALVVFADDRTNQVTRTLKLAEQCRRCPDCPGRR